MTGRKLVPTYNIRYMYCMYMYYYYRTCNNYVHTLRRANAQRYVSCTVSRELSGWEELWIRREGWCDVSLQCETMCCYTHNSSRLQPEGMKWQTQSLEPGSSSRKGAEDRKEGDQGTENQDQSAQNSHTLQSQPQLSNCECMSGIMTTNWVSRPHLACRLNLKKNK